jgi:hypothetical protein
MRHKQQQQHLRRRNKRKERFPSITTKIEHNYRRLKWHIKILFFVAFSSLSCSHALKLNASSYIFAHCMKQQGVGHRNDFSKKHKKCYNSINRKCHQLMSRNFPLKRQFIEKLQSSGVQSAINNCVFLHRHR